jgi:hypothetical protein
MSAEPNANLASEVRQLERRVWEVRSFVIHEFSERLRDPRLSKVERLELERRLKKAKGGE